MSSNVLVLCQTPNTSSTRSDDAGYTVFTELELTEERKTVLFIRTT
jgi:hypothetical protein